MKLFTFIRDPVKLTHKWPQPNGGLPSFLSHQFYALTTTVANICNITTTTTIQDSRVFLPEMEILALLLNCQDNHLFVIPQQPLTCPQIPKQDDLFLLKFCLIPQTALCVLINSHIYFMASNSWNQLLIKNKYCLPAARRVQTLETDCRMKISPICSGLQNVNRDG